jgi:hypothetical protein
MHVQRVLGSAPEMKLFLSKPYGNSALAYSYTSDVPKKMPSKLPTYPPAQTCEASTRTASLGCTAISKCSPKED